MARRQLNVSGSKITKIQASIQSKLNVDRKVQVDYVKLDIEAEGDVWEYDIRSDDRAPDLNQIVSELTNALTQAQTDFSKVEIKEYKERFYLFVDVQDHLDKQYTGEKIL